MSKINIDNFQFIGFFFIVVGLGIIVIFHDPEFNKYGFGSCIIGAGLMMVSYQKEEVEKKKAQPTERHRYTELGEPAMAQLLDKNGNVLQTQYIDEGQRKRLR